MQAKFCIQFKILCLNRIEFQNILNLEDFTYIEVFDYEEITGIK